MQRNSSINILLSALSLIDICLLLFAISVFVLPNLQSWYKFQQYSIFLIAPREEFYSEEVQAIIVKFLYPANLIFQVNIKSKVIYVNFVDMQHLLLCADYCGTMAGNLQTLACGLGSRLLILA